MEIPVSGSIAIYRGKRYPIAFTGDDWIALQADAGPELPDAFAAGSSQTEPGHYLSWVKVPRSSAEGFIYRTVTGFISGHAVSILNRFHSGKIGVEFIGSPAVARELRLNGDQQLGWTGLFDPEDFDRIEVEEKPYA